MASVTPAGKAHSWASGDALVDSVTFQLGGYRAGDRQEYIPPRVPFVPLRRMGGRAEVALHLASAASSFTTGAIIRVDGGVTKKVRPARSRPSS
jgi:NAD(P)-dependent dehydrogenase (short-subunit alcohol dehydrogenase family)